MPVDGNLSSTLHISSNEYVCH